VRLLVSVKSPAEVGPALAGGADIIDAKDPSRGPLGAVAPDKVAAILAAVADDTPFSVALGDVATVEAVMNAITSLPSTRRPGSCFIKLGFAGLQSPSAVGRLLQTAVASAANHASRPEVIAVAYADADRSGTLPPHEIVERAAGSGCSGVLLDTYHKNEGGVLALLSCQALADWLALARGAGLLTAIAGGLEASDLPTILAIGPEIIGVRGAACEGGRDGRVTVERVRALRYSLDRASFQTVGTVT
jgi:uncharacterized protein (UPF0264 family)